MKDQNTLLKWTINTDTADIQCVTLFGYLMFEFMNTACQSFEYTYHSAHHQQRLLLLTCDILSLILTSFSQHTERLE